MVLLWEILGDRFIPCRTAAIWAIRGGSNPVGERLGLGAVHQRTGPIRSRLCLGLLLPIAAGLVVGGCVERRVVNWNPPLSNLPGARSGMQPQGDRFANLVDPTRISEEKLVVENSDGSRRVIARSGRHLMIHVYNALAEQDRELFLDQVLSDMTRREFEERGRDPGEAFDMLLARREDIVLLFNAMPNGEYTPGVVWDKLSAANEEHGNIVRLTVTGPVGRDLAWNAMDMVMEGGHWRLRWFGKHGG